MDKIADAWLMLSYFPEKSEEHEKNFWAFERLSNLCENDPEAAWSVIEEIFQKDSNDLILSNLGAGPLEDLLAKHGAQFIDRIERRAAKDEKFRKLLGIVWRNEIPEDVWQRIKAVAAPSW
ncbi:MAG TPA: hypothetical protein VJ770_30350 [Stellaceae bacterium]|nr:hypothetical protein [Stellaceae bacterium]